MKLIILLLGTLIAGCQWSSYNSYDYVDGEKTQETHIGTIEFCIIDSKKGLSVELAEGTKLDLASTKTDPDEDTVLIMLEALDQWLTINAPYTGVQ